jgi:hypothetical protein
MLFHVTHTHDYSTCFTHVPEKTKIFNGIVDAANANGVTIHGRYVNRMEHTTFFILEADSFEQIDAAFVAVLEFGHFEITPVIKK